VVEPKVPPRSPDLNPCDFLWEYLKQLVYSQSINSVEELTGRVAAAIAQIREDREVF
jgi:transposase